MMLIFILEHIVVFMIIMESREGIDWQDEVFGSTGITQNHNVNITGGTEKTKYMISYNYTDENGIMAKHGYQKNSIRAKVNHELWKGVRLIFF